MKLRPYLLAVLPLGTGILTAVLAFPGSGSVTSTQKPSERIDYNRQIRPILSEYCWKCHGPDAAANARTGGVRLDSFAGATKKMDGIAPLVPGKAAESLLIERISAKEAGTRMPPADSGVPALTSEQIRLLETWINQGAEYQAHWAFVPPTTPALPEVKDVGRVRNEIDRFILKKLESAGLGFEPEASPRTLIRRVAMTLTGLPPTVSEVNEFLKDKSPKAYSRMVDRFLASPRYGEHQARYWLDAVRYGDTHGLHLDNERAIYPYRDWVVRSFNDDLSFDKFTLWQLGGDLLPNPTLDQKIATAYVRMNVTTNEGGAIEEEFLARNTFDRVDTTSTVYLGLTAGCAKCHDHKFDPISQKDYYSLFAFFNSTKDAPLDGNLLTPEPAIKAPSPEQVKVQADVKAQLGKMLNKVNLRDAQKWIAGNRVPQPESDGWEVSDPYPGKSFAESFDTAYAPETEGSKGVTWKPLKLELGKAIAVVNRESACAYVRGNLKLDVGSKVTFKLGSDDAIKMWIDGKLVHSNNILRGVEQSADTVTVDLSKGQHQVLAKIVNGGGPDAFRIAFGDERAQRIDRVFREMNDPEKRSDVCETYLEVGPESKQATDYKAAKTKLNEVEAAIPFCLVAEEMPKPRPAFVLRRGEYNLPTTEVHRAIPAALGTWPKDAPLNRLGFAQWLISKENPIVSRVFVNRIWQQHFGTGIVKTSEDFGNQGEWPSHPELLDFLAKRFIKDGWSLKQLHRVILNSETFRQAATSNELKRTLDPENRLLSRGVRFRLDGEVLRDEVLYVSGLLNSVEAGKGFKPYQPDGIWEALGFLESNTARYVQDKDNSIYRRSLYMFWKRTSPHPVLLSFDAPMRESCSVRRSRTNTPLQALVTMNEPMFVEAARVFAERLLQLKADDKARIAKLVEICYARPASEREIQALQKSLKAYEAEFSSPDADFQILSIGDSKFDSSLPAPKLAAMTLVVSTIFNTDEFLTQH